jgi:hypothetical protein
MTPKKLKSVFLEHSSVRLFNVHSATDCKGRSACPIHKRTEHSMRKFPQLWRTDRGIMERICPHGIGHPDPDQWEYFVSRMGETRARYEFFHGCDGCCASTVAVAGEFQEKGQE